MEDEKYKNISDFSHETILKELSPLTPEIFVALETANEIAPECISKFCDKQSIEPDNKKVIRSLYPTLMRAIVQVLLHSKKYKTQALLENDGNVKDILDWECHILSNNGLAGKYAEYSYKILKAFYGKLPPPGTSRKKQDFYKQKHMMQSRFNISDTNSDIKIALPKPNVIYLWDKVNSSTIVMYLSCPSGGDATHAYNYFTVPIEHPALTYKPVIKPEEIVEEIDLTVIEPEPNVMSDDEENNNDDLREPN